MRRPSVNWITSLKGRYGANRITQEYRKLLGTPEGNVLILTSTDRFEDEVHEESIHCFDEMDENLDIINTHRISYRVVKAFPSERFTTVVG